MKIVCLMSGGIDSFLMSIMLRENGHEVFPLFVNYGQLALEKEYDSYLRVCDHMNLVPESIDISKFGAFITSGITDSNLDVVDDAFLPNRNLLFLILASSYAYQKDVYSVAIGVIDNPIFPDQTKRFFESAEQSIKESLEVDMKIISPLLDLNKLDIYKLAYEHKLPLDVIYYCHKGGATPCNECLACKEHIVAKKQISQMIEAGEIDWE